MTLSETREKWDARYADLPLSEPEASRVLSENRHLLPTDGKALDFACGRGGNALLLAASGLQTSAWDISPVVIAQLREFCDARGVAVEAQVRDVLHQPPEAGAYDVITVSRFLERSLLQALAAALTPGGVLFYQSFTQEKSCEVGPRSPQYLLEKNELLTAYRGLRVLSFRDEGTQGNMQAGLRHESWIILQNETLS